MAKIVNDLVVLVSGTTSAGIVTQIKNGQMLVNGRWYAELPNIKVGDPVYIDPNGTVRKKVRRVSGEYRV